MKQECLSQIPEEAIFRKEMASLAEFLPGAACRCRVDGGMTILQVNPYFLELCGFTRQELRDQFQDSLLRLTDPDDRLLLEKAVQEAAASDGAMDLEYRICRKDGTSVWVLGRGRMAPMPDGSLCCYSVLLDITRERRERDELRLSLERHRVIMDQATDIIFEWDIQADTMTFSANWQKKFGYPPLEGDLFRSIPQAGYIHPEDTEAFLHTMRSLSFGSPYAEAELRLRDAMGNYTWCRMRATTQFDIDGNPLKVIGVLLDIQQEKIQRDNLMEQASRDPLTGLLNKGAVKTAVEQHLGMHGHPAGAMMIIDLDNFKNINDTYGHLCGDTVLSDVASKLRHGFRRSDVLGRIGGDEFLVFLPGIPHPKALVLAQVIVRLLRGIEVQGKPGQIGGSIGIAFYPEDGKDFYELYRNADRALYYVKSTSKGGYAMYEPDMGDREMPHGALPRTVVGGVIESQHDAVSEQLAQYSFRTLYSAEDIMTAVPHLLEIIGRSYNVSRAYIFENSDDNHTCSNTFEWCAEGVPSEMAGLQGVSYEKELKGYQESFIEKGLVCCNDIQGLPEPFRLFLERQGIHAILQCAILDNGIFRGFVGFDDCQCKREWTREQVNALTLIAHVISVFLLKYRLKQRLDAYREKQGTD